MSLLAALLALPIALASPSTDFPPSAPELSAPRPLWMVRLDDARRLNRTGTAMGVGGTAAMVVGAAVVVLGGDRPGFTATGLLTMAGGAVSFSVGGPVTLVSAMQGRRAVELATGRPLSGTHVVAGWVSYLLLGGIPTYVFAHLQWRENLTALDQAGMLARPRIEARVVPSPGGLAVALRF